MMRCGWHVSSRVQRLIEGGQATRDRERERESEREVRMKADMLR